VKLAKYGPFARSLSDKRTAIVAGVACGRNAVRGHGTVQPFLYTHYSESSSEEPVLPLETWRSLE
jgi:hypothetical protein